MPRKPPRSTEERIARTQKSMTPGTLGGRVASAAPMSVDASRLDARLRTQKRPLVGASFDPNVDPVVIGNGASAAADHGVAIGMLASISGSASTDAVAIGWQASAAATLATAVGPYAAAGGVASVAVGEATASSVDAVAIGDGAEASDLRAISVGASAVASATDTISVGSSASAAGQSSSALGASASVGATHANSTALGAGATTTKAHQVMVGTASEFMEIAGSGVVQKDIVTGTRYLIQIASGALVLNAAP